MTHARLIAGFFFAAAAAVGACNGAGLREPSGAGTGGTTVVDAGGKGTGGSGIASADSGAPTGGAAAAPTRHLGGGSAAPGHGLGLEGGLLPFAPGRLAFTPPGQPPI